jgi:hypothetical protein
VRKSFARSKFVFFLYLLFSPLLPSTNSYFYDRSALALASLPGIVYRSRIVYLRLILSLSFLIGLFIFTDGPARGAQETPAPGGWRTYTNTNCIFDLAIWGDEVWAATCGGVVRWNRTDGSYIVYTVADGLPHNNIAVIAVDPQGHIWAAPNQSDMLTVFDGQAWTVYTAAAGLPGGSINAIVVDRAGYIWLGGGSGQLSKSVGSVLNGPHPRPLSWNVAATLDYPIYSLAIDSGGRVWAGTYEGGVTLIDGQSQTTYTVANGLPDNFINDIALDPSGRVWLACYRGCAGTGLVWNCRRPYPL